MNKQQIPTNVAAFLMTFILRYKSEFFMLLFTSISYATFQSLVPYLIKLVINTGTSKNLNLPINNIIFFLCGIWIILQLFINFQGICIYKTFPKFKSVIKIYVFNYVSKFNESFFTHISNGSISKCINNIANSSEKIIQIFLFNILSIICIFVLSLTIMAHASIIFASLLLIWFVLHTFISYFFIKKGIKYESEYTTANQNTSSFVDDVLSNLTNAKLFCMLTEEQKKHTDFNSIEMHHYKKGIFHYEKMKIIQSILITFFITSVLCSLISFIHGGKITLGDFTMIAMLSFTLINFVNNTSSQSIHIAREIGILKANLQIINHNYFNQDIAGNEIESITNIRLLNVSFFYDNGNTIIDNLSFTIRAGDKIGITGSSGQGKTTFIKLLLGIYKAQQGSIMINGLDINQIPKEYIYNKISVIFQEPILINCSIKDNIKYGNPKATDEEIYAAAKLACCHDFICELTTGYETHVNAHGLTLSGGQKQRIALARIILRNTPIIIMDEPTSALDSRTEECIQKNIQNYLANKTVIIISHKSIFLSLVDKTYIFENGKILAAKHDKKFNTTLNFLTINK